MILVDTSVFINYLKKVDNNEKTEQFNEILSKGIPFGINNFIYQELLQGCRTERDYRQLKIYLDCQKFYDVKKGRESFANAARIYSELRKKGITVRSTIDCLIAQIALEHDLYLLHDDMDFDRIAEYFPLKVWM